MVCLGRRVFSRSSHSEYIPAAASILPLVLQVYIHTYICCSRTEAHNILYRPEFHIRQLLKCSRTSWLISLKAKFFFLPLINVVYIGKFLYHNITPTIVLNFLIKNIQTPGKNTSAIDFHQ